MAKKQTIEKTAKTTELKLSHPDTAGIDVGKDLLQVCIPAERCVKNNRCFHSYTRDIKEIIEWLKGHGIRRAVMESTGSYWVPLFLKLQDSGIESILVNAKAVKNMNGRKSDFNDAEWLMFLGCYDLVTPCFQPSSMTRRLRNLVRGRNDVLRDMSSYIMRMQQDMEQMNIKLSSVLRDITGKSGMDIIGAILAGERDPEVLAGLADWRCKKSREEIAGALHGTWDEDLLFDLAMNLKAYRQGQERVGEYDMKIDEMANAVASEACAVRPERPLERNAKPRTMKNRTKVDIERYAYEAWGVNVASVPGISGTGLLGLLSELGPDFVSRFPSASKFCRWCNLVPDNEVTGGQIIRSRVGHQKCAVGQIFRCAAMSMANSKCAIGDFYRRIRSRNGGMAANVATAHKIAKIFYTMIAKKEEYKEEKVAKSEKELLEQKIHKLMAKKEAMERKLKSLDDAD